jgi:hypothetical protein
MMLSWNPVRAPVDVDRYASIAEDLARVSAEAPLFDDDAGGEHTAVTLAAIASLESFFAADVDALRKFGDGGKARGLLQVHMLPGEAPCFDRLSCLRVGRERVRLSMDTCRRLPAHERLSQFTTGRCQHNPEGRWRMARATSAWRTWTTTTTGAR